jgi:hypothetical protein
MKKIKSKKKFKGIRYVANVLKKYFKKKYPTYNSALPKAREVYTQLTSTGQKITVANIQFLVRKRRAVKPGEKAPLLFYKLTSPEPYFELVKYSQYISVTTSEVYFISDIFNEGVDYIQGGTKSKYKDTFQGFVNFANRQASEKQITESDDIEIYVMCTKPEKGTGTLQGKWVSRIVTTDSSGTEQDFGYDPTAQTPTILQPEQPTEQPTATQIPKEPKKPTTPDVEVLKIQAQTEQTRQENLNLAMKLFGEGKITKLEYKDMVSEINKNK